MKFFDKPSKFLPLILFIASLMIFSYNLESQGPYRDEPTFNAWGIEYYKLTLEGNFLDPCWNGLEKCERMHLKSNPGTDYIEEDISHWITHTGLVKSFLVGLGHELSGTINEANTYEWTKWILSEEGAENIRDEKFPTPEQLAAGRFFSPLLGSLTVVFAFFIGSTIFNKFTGITFSLMLLFHSLWFWNSRTVMSELFTGFFILLSIVFLIKAGHGNMKVKYLLLSSFVIGLAVNTKMLAIIVIPFLIIMIFLSGPYKEKIISWKGLNLRKNIRKFQYVGLYLGFFVLIIFITDPFYYSNPIEQVQLLQDSMSAMSAYGPYTLPSLDSQIHLKAIGVFSATVLPVVDYYFINFQPEEIPENLQGRNFIIANYSSIAVTTFFIIGSIFLIYKIRMKELTRSELFILLWFLSIFSFTSAIIGDSLNIERHYALLFFPLLLIMSFGLNEFLKNLSKKMKIIMFLSLLSSHSIGTLVFWEKFYFEPQLIWSSPLPIYFQESLTFSITIYVGILFFVVFGIVIVKKIRLRQQRQN